MFEDRLDRQLRIPGWNQSVLERAKIGVVGDSDYLASHYLLAAAALGICNLVVIAPWLHEGLADAASQLNPKLRLTHVEGFYTHPMWDDIFRDCQLIVDLSQFGLANKLMLNRAYQDDVPLVRAFCYQKNNEQGCKVFTYRKGREWQELEEIVCARQLPGECVHDGILGIIAAGLALEDTKNVLLGWPVPSEVVSYKSKQVVIDSATKKICVVGAGALGNFVGLALGFSGFRHITFIDPDVVEVTNLNRQVLLHAGVGSNKAEILARRLNSMFTTEAVAVVDYLSRDSDISGFDVVFDCVDNFESRIVISELCQLTGKMLVSGGSNVAAGQVIVYSPGSNDGTPAELLGLQEIVAERQISSFRRLRESCIYRPEPSVIMTNQIIAGIMVDSYRLVLAGEQPANVFYDASSDLRFAS
ncbi:MAG: ThiF family adenylyltransferase [Deltaproteobacteria bacterium]|nr:ThiF family adenylyltransferase [Deltaproteobacteria bacterium]